MDDIQIIGLFWRRDESAVAEVSAQYGAYCHSVAMNILDSGEDADECVNDTWLRAWNSIPPQRPEKLRIFLAQITRNLSFDRFRAKAAEKRGSGEITAVLDELEECIPSSSDVEDEFCAKELGSIVNRFLLTLPERDRRIFLRRYFYAEPVSKTAVLFSLTESNVMTILSRTRGRLKTYLEKENYIR